MTFRPYSLVCFFFLFISLIIAYRREGRGLDGDNQTSTKLIDAGSSCFTGNIVDMSDGDSGGGDDSEETSLVGQVLPHLVFKTVHILFLSSLSLSLSLSLCQCVRTHKYKLVCFHPFTSSS